MSNKRKAENHLQKSTVKENSRSTISQSEVEKFSKLASQWWDRNGKLKTLHDINPVRLKFIIQSIFEGLHIQNFNNDIKILDVGCGGGLVSVPLAKMGANVLGIDASLENIKIAKQYLKENGLDKKPFKIDYECSSIETLKSSTKFDVVLALEVIEHVSDARLFLNQISKHLKPGGLLIVSTINRTLKSLVLAKIGAEYILRWLPTGTHSWRSFLSPEEIISKMGSGFQVFSKMGMKYSILNKSWHLDEQDLSMNYLMCMISG